MSECNYGRCPTCGNRDVSTPTAAWIQTYTGKAFYPLAPRVEDICIEDIAHALSMKCRFTGHCRRFYSVAEHSLYVSRFCPPELRLWGLLHDAAEAYLPDVARPIKVMLPELQSAESRVLVAVAKRFGLPWDFPCRVKDIDLRMLATEADQLLGPPPTTWESIRDVERLPVALRYLAPHEAEREFLSEFRLLAKPQ